VRTGFDVSQEPAHTVVRTVSETLPAVVYSIPKAHYTESARAAHVTGDVILRVRFTANGSVEVLEVIQSPEYGLEDVARSVALGIAFKPATRDGQTVDSEHVVTVQFPISDWVGFAPNTTRCTQPCPLL
jgi:TonB family protein